MNDRIIQQLIGKVKNTLAELAENAMTYPSAEPFSHGVSCGRHQGLQMALEILDSIIRDDLDDDAKL